jgi:uncharacterized membrane protein YphA (DoxX/SURF4 family)
MAISKSLRLSSSGYRKSPVNVAPSQGREISDRRKRTHKHSQMTRIYLGRHVYGLAAIIFGILIFVWRDVNVWREILPIGKVSHPEILLYIAAAIQLFGGLAIQWAPTCRIGALSLTVIYLIFALLSVPAIIAKPLIYNNWGNFFEQFSLVSGALIVFGAPGPNNHEGPPALARIGYFSFGVCVISFALEQWAYLSATASLVPKWILPSQMFWAITTTIAFALAAIAILFGRTAILASRLLTLMLIGFLLLVWLPIVISHPHTLFNWTESTETLAIAGAARIVTDFLTQNRSAALHTP